MAAHQVPYIKIEDSPSPEPSTIPSNAAPENQNTSPQHCHFAPAHVIAATLSAVTNTTPTVDPRDPEGFLKRCAGFNKKTKARCNSVIGKKSEQSCHPTFLPTCRAHRDQQSFAGWCQYQRGNGERCSRLFRWTPPYFELCSEHQGHPDTPCYFMRLPLELRHEVFRYLLPDQPIGSTTAPLHKAESMQPPETRQHGRAELIRLHQQQSRCGGLFSVPLLSLYLVSRQFYHEVKDLLFSIAPFTIDVRKDGTFMCGRRLLEPRRADGSSHFLLDEADEAKQRFLKYFDWSAVKHYIVDILVENGANGSHLTWDEEVELYDIRDYLSVVVSGVLAKARNLCKLNIRLCLANFPWSHEQTLANTKLIVGPFESLRNVRQPQIQSIYMGIPIHNSMLYVQRSSACSGSSAPVCSVPPLPTQIPILVPGMPDFDAYASAWSRWISSSSATTLVPKAPIRIMFTAFKDFYSELSSYVPEVTFIVGRKAFLHRARVAREQEDVEAFRALRNEAIAYWSAYLDREERKKNAMDAKMGRMLDMDVYPSHEWEDPHSTTDSTRAMPPPSKPELSKTYNGKAGASMCRAGDSGKAQNLNDYDEQLQILEAQSRKRIALVRRQQQQAQQHAEQRKQQTWQQQLSQEISEGFTGTMSLPDLVDSKISSNATPTSSNDATIPLPLTFVSATSSSSAEVPPSPEYHIDATDIACYAHVNLSSEWCTGARDSAAGPGPASQLKRKRRVDSGFSEMDFEMEGEGGEAGYVGKGKGRIGVGVGVVMDGPEVICID
ncbi:hypothetical protein DE146DRAFT_420142 [Phaeosphaeria sp. MPI-PUGE-AT-0046c]|nr:hypothetical protein DE146DRAFT_420142 [Phaeosphaeria sp. MPI-PUGE-AT-0046c]